MSLARTRNQFFGMRHGESKANVLGIIISDLEAGKQQQFALSDKGKQQALQSAELWLQQFRQQEQQQGQQTPRIVVYSSPFSRAFETAQILTQKLSAALSYNIPLNTTDDLRERYFGEWEGTSNVNYEKVWSLDSTDDNNNKQGVESPSQLVQRTSALIQKLDDEHENSVIFLVSHGDCLQITQTLFFNVPAGKHRDLPHWDTAEIKPLSFATTTTPAAATTTATTASPATTSTSTATTTATDRQES